MARDAERLCESLATAERFEDVVNGHDAEDDKARPSSMQHMSTMIDRQESLRDVSQVGGENDPPMVRDLNKEIGERLRIIRAELQLSQVQMGRYLGIDRGRWWHWENAGKPKPGKAAKPKPGKQATKVREPKGKQGNLPALDVMILLAEKTDITLDYIYRGKHEGLKMAMSIRLAAREQGLDPDDPEWTTARGKKALRAKAGV
jgi:transcriptional regulator with XRE-family HTH domain